MTDTAARHRDFHWKLGAACVEEPGHLQSDEHARCQFWERERARVVTPSRTDRQPPNTSTQAKGGLSAVGPDETKQPDLVTTHDTETP